MRILEGTSTEPVVTRKPRDDELDVFGLTHPGKVRPENQDHFLLCSLRKEVAVHLTSLPGLDQISGGTERVAFLAMVADGVGGGMRGEEASRLAVEAVTEYVTQSVRCYYSGSAEDEEFARSLEDAAQRCHDEVVRRAGQEPESAGMATTLTLWLSVWPRSYLLQVGDSRCYMLRRGELIQVSRDQTMAQELVDLGVLTREAASKTPLANTLSSSIGGSQTAPLVTRFDPEWDSVGLLCSDGLTRHVSDERIRDRLRSMTSARQACHDLLEDALDAGGEDNITVLVGRMVRRDLE
ncbi:MAG: protein phosphatase 2C domain-containing protein [Gemmatimonadales bacterium]